MLLLLHPIGEGDDSSLSEQYETAIEEAIELHIVSAYLTDWSVRAKLRKDCDELTFIVGTDFGITTKDACRSVLKWLPRTMKNDFLAADNIGGFHPKLVLWKNEAGECSVILGSSNLTKAAFSTNYEANARFSVSQEQYEDIKSWIYAIRLQCSPISEDWIDEYVEASRPSPKRSGRKAPVVSLELPEGDDIDAAIKRRRAQQKSFAQIREPLIDIIDQCASGKMANADFYDAVMELWGSHDSRFQGRGFEISGKHSDWKEVCASLLRVVKKSGGVSLVVLDNAVRKEIDRLASQENPTRGAWFTEMLCHFYPDKYPIVNKPVKMWLKYNKYKPSSRASEGAQYIDLSVKMRNAVQENRSNKAKNLAELDHAIWQWYELEFADA